MQIKYPEYIVTPSELRMADNFKLFLWFMWRELGLPEPTELQLEIADYVQHGPRRRIIEAFRGCGKSWITAIYVLWLLWRDPQHRVLVVSASKDRSDAFSIFVKQLIANTAMLRVLEPRDGQRSSNIAFDVGPAKPDQSPSVRSVGITGQMTGGRADTIVADDVEIPKNSATEFQREKLAESVKEFDAVLKPNGQVVYLGTPQVEQSLYNELQTRGYSCRVWPARYILGEGSHAGRLAPRLRQMAQDDSSLIDHSTEAGRFSDIDLMEREASYGRSGFALQFMLDTSLSDAERYPLKLRDLVVCDIDDSMAPIQTVWASGPDQEVSDLVNVGLNGDRFYRPMYQSKEFSKFDGCCMFVDPSGRGADETAYAVVKMLKGMLFLVAWGGFAGGYDTETLKALSEIAKKNAVNHIGVEANYGDGMFTALWEPILHATYPCVVEEYKVLGQKELRIIEKLEPILNQHRLVVDRQVLVDDLKGHGDVDTKRKLSFSGAYQLTHLTKDRGALRHDDRIDVLAEAVGYWTEKIGNDVRMTEVRHMDKLREKDLRDFVIAHGKIAGVSGNKNWNVPRAPKKRRGRKSTWR